MVYISFLISHVPPAHSFFQKKSILINPTQNLVQLIFLRLLNPQLKRMPQTKLSRASDQTSPEVLEKSDDSSFCDSHNDDYDSF